MSKVKKTFSDINNKNQLDSYVFPKCENILINASDAVRTSYLYCSCAQEIFKKPERPPYCPRPGCGEELTSEEGRPFFPGRSIFVRKEIGPSRFPVFCLNRNFTSYSWEGELGDHLGICVHEKKECQQCKKTISPLEHKLHVYNMPSPMRDHNEDIKTMPAEQEEVNRFLQVDEKESVIVSENDGIYTYQDAILTSSANDGYLLGLSVCDMELLKSEQEMKELECPLCNEAFLTKKYQAHNCFRAILDLVLCPLKDHGCNEGSEMSREECLNHLTSKQGIYNHMLMIATTLSSFVTSSTSTSSVALDGNLVENDSSQHTAKLRSASPSRRSVHVDGPNGPDDFGFLSDHVPEAVGGGYRGGDGMGSNKLMSLVMSKITGIQAEMTKKESMIHTLQDKVARLESTLSSKQNENEDRDFRLSLMENRNFDGSMVWKIPQFSQHMVDARTGKYTSIFSSPFYSSRYGYKMCLRLYILGDGIGKGTHMSLFFVVMKGEFDNILQWPFTHKVTFKLINQCGSRDIMDIFQPDPLSSSFQKPKSDMNVASGCPRFVSMNELMQGGFIVDDTIFIKVKVDTATMHHP